MGKKLCAGLLFVALSAIPQSALAEFLIEMMDGSKVITKWYEIREAEQVVVYRDMATGQTRKLDGNKVIDIRSYTGQPASSTTTTEEDASQSASSKRSRKSYGSEKNREKIESYQSERKEKRIQQLDRQIQALEEVTDMYRDKISKYERQLQQMRRNYDQNKQQIKQLEEYVRAGQFEMDYLVKEMQALKQEKTELLYD